jgi:FKBP-type peptidyl-prolyl cis-trans isomerase FkpA
MKLIAMIFVLALFVSACGDGDSGTSPTPGSVPFSTTDLRAGTGATAATGRSATVRYSGWLYSTAAGDNKGKQFDAGTFNFTVGQGVIPGFTQGVLGMQVGGIRRVVIPPNLGYGSAGSPPDIPSNATLIFEIELLAIS